MNLRQLDLARTPLRYEVVVSLEAGAVCPGCSEGRLEEVHEPRRHLVCPVCQHRAKAGVHRLSLRYPLIPSVDGYDVYARLYVTSPDETSYTMFAVDVDTGSYADAERVYGLLTDAAGPVVQWYHSGAKGYHLVIPLETWSYSSPNWPAVFRALVELLDIQNVADPSIYKHRAMLRVPGTVNTKTGKRKTLLVNAQSTRIRPEWEELVRKAEKMAPNLYSRETVAMGEPWTLLQEFNPPCVSKLWLQGLPYKGSRHLAYVHLASFYARRGDAQDEAAYHLSEFARIHGEHTDTPEAARVDAAQRIIRSAYRTGLSFVCQRGRDLGVCEEACPIHAK